MRRLSVHRPTAKVRNPDRHLRRLRAWAESAVGYYPARPEGGDYLNWKIPVLDRLVDPPTARREWQVEAVAGLLLAAGHYMAAKPASEQGRSWVAVLITLPNLWFSELAIFFDPMSYEPFTLADEALGHRSLCGELGIALPPGLVEVGRQLSWASDDETGEAVGECWTIGEPMVMG